MANRDAPAAGRFGDIGICALPAIGEARDLLTFLVAVLLATMVIALMIYICFAYSDRVPRLLGAVGTDILVRLTAFILFCLGVQIIWTGASELLGTVTLQRATMAMPLVTTEDFFDNCSCVGARLRQCAKSSSPADRLLPIAHRSCHRSRPDASRSSAYALRVSKISIAGRARPLRAPSPGASFFGGFRTRGTVHLASPEWPASETLHIAGPSPLGASSGHA